MTYAVVEAKVRVPASSQDVLTGDLKEFPKGDKVHCDLEASSDKDGVTLHLRPLNNDGTMAAHSVKIRLVKSSFQALCKLGVSFD